MTPTARTPSAEDLLAQARQATGLSDFGAPTFREGLDVLLRSLVADTGFTQPQVDGALAVVRRRLVNRLLIEDWYRAHPEVAQQTLESPVSIIGLPRTGTTALANIMSLDNQFRSLRMWEQAKPCPPPVLADEATDPRRLEMEQEIDRMLKANPALAAMHLFDLEATSEDTEVLGLEFKAQQFTNPVTGYHNWWRACDMVPAYAYHRRVALLLQSRRPPNRWLFKAPHHKFHLDAIAAAYPEMKFVMTHRDPVKSVPSYASFVSNLYPPGCTALTDPVMYGRHTCEHLRDGMARAVAARERLGEHRFMDVYHRDFVRDPFGTLERVYAWLGLELRPQVRATMQRWHADNRSGAHGEHRYTAEQFGLSKAQLRADFEFYTTRFNVPLEA